MSSLTSLQKLYPVIEAAIQVEPRVTIQIDNYHWEETRDSGSSRSTRYPAYTHCYTHIVETPHWIDRSAPLSTLCFL
jgi:hypothetical protein